MTNTGPVHHSAAVIGGSDVLLVETLEERAQAASAAVERALRRAVEKSTFDPAVLDASKRLVVTAALPGTHPGVGQGIACLIERA